MISWRSFSAFDSCCSTSADTFELQSASGSPASSSLHCHSRVVAITETAVAFACVGVDTTSIDTLGLSMLRRAFNCQYVCAKMGRAAVSVSHQVYCNAYLEERLELELVG